MSTIYKTISILIVMSLTYFPIFGQCEVGTDTTSIELPTGKVHINNRGILGISSDLLQSSPQSLDQKWIGGIWLAGINTQNNFIKINIADHTNVFSTSQASFWPGPSTATEEFNDQSICEDWDKIFNVRASDIDVFLDDFNDNGIIDNTIPENIRGWPAIGNPYFFEVYGFDLPFFALAPFIDQNGDGIYNPSEGDYPNTKGAENTNWWILNTNGNLNTVNIGDLLNVDFHIMTSQFNSNDEFIENSIVYDISMVNRNEEMLDSLFFSFWIDPDSKCKNEYVGCIPEENISFMYESGEYISTSTCPKDDFQSRIIGLKQLSPIFAPRVTDENDNLVYPRIGMEADTFVAQHMSSFKHYFNPSTTTIQNQTDPQNPLHFYNVMQGLWRDGEAQLVNGMPSRYSFPGNPAFPQEGDNPMCSFENSIEDIRTLTSCGPFRLQPGQSQSISYALVTRIETENVDCIDTDVLSEGFMNVESIIAGDATVSSTSTISEKDLNVYPNPVQDELYLSMNGVDQDVQSVEIIDVEGKVERRTVSAHASEIIIDVSDYTKGMYFIRLISKQNTIYAGKFIKM